MTTKKRLFFIVLLSMLIVVISSIFCFASEYTMNIWQGEATDLVYHFTYNGSTHNVNINYGGSNATISLPYDTPITVYCNRNGSENKYLLYYYFDFGSNTELSRNSASPTHVPLTNSLGNFVTLTNGPTFNTSSSFTYYIILDSPISFIEAPVISLTSNYGISVPIEENATGFEIQKLDSRGDWQDYAQELYSAPGGHSVFELTVFGSYRVRYITNKSGYTDSEWSEPLTFSGVPLAKPFLRMVGNTITPDPYDENVSFYDVAYSSDNTNWTYESVSSFPYVMNRVGYYKFRAVSSGFPYTSSVYSNTISYIPTQENQLSTPTLSISSNDRYRLSWNSVPHATAYMVYINGVQLSKINGTYFDVYRNGNYQVQALGNEDYSNSPLSNSITISDFGSPTIPDTPTPPSDDEGGILSWLKYFIDKIDYFFELILHGIKTVIGGAIESITTFIDYIGDFVQSVGNLFSFLPDEILTLITSCIFIVALVGILRVFL